MCMYLFLYVNENVNSGKICCVLQHPQRRNGRRHHHRRRPRRHIVFNEERRLHFRFMFTSGTFLTTSGIGFFCL